MVKNEIIHSAYTILKPTMPSKFDEKMHGQALERALSKLFKENSTVFEGRVLRKLIKYKNKFIEAKQVMLARQVNVLDKQPSDLTAELIFNIKHRIGEKYYEILYTTKGFHNTFMVEFWKAQKALLSLTKEQNDPVKQLEG